MSQTIRPLHNTTAPPMPSKAIAKPLAQCASLQEAFETREIRERIADAIPKHMNPDAMLRTFVQAASKTPLIYQCDLRQSLGAFLSISYLGLTPGTALQLVHLIPFKTKRWNPKARKLDDVVDLNVIIGYPGYLELAHRSGLIKSVHADIVLPGEHFRAEHGTHKILEHRPELDRDSEGLSPRAAYAFVNMADEGDQFEVMPWADVLKIRNRSQAFRTALAAREEAEQNGKRLPPKWTDAPWVKDEREMGKKTAFRRVAKWLPKCPELRAGVALEEAQDRGRLNYGAVIDGVATPLDGIPEAEDDPTPVDPGAAFGMRGGNQPTDDVQSRDEPVQQAHARPTQPHARPTQSRGEPVQQQTRRGPAEPAPAPAFEAVLISAEGEILADNFASASAFARAFLKEWHAAGNEAEALREHNADALEEAMNDPLAAGILAEMNDAEGVIEGTVEPDVEPPEVVVKPPVERGRTSWTGYVKAIKQALGTIPQDAFEDWVAAQRQTLTQCPLAQRVLAIRAIAEAAGLRNLTPPAWLGALMIAPKPAERAAPEAKKSEDELWVEATVHEISTLSTLGALNKLIVSPDVRSRMASLRTANKPLFDRADAAFGKRHGELSADESENPGAGV